MLTDEPLVLMPFSVSVDVMKLGGPVLFILTTLMIDAIGIGIVFPIMPDLMNRVGADSTAEGAFWGGIMMSVRQAQHSSRYSCVFHQSPQRPLTGHLADKFRQRPQPATVVIDVFRALIPRKFSGWSSDRQHLAHM